MGKVLSFGELLLRICPDGEGEWLKENKLPFYVGGAELNVATALALWQIPSAYFTALPINLMSDQLMGYMESCNIDISRIDHSGDRIGLYYLPKGKDLKNAGVIYDRANSAFASLKAENINWDQVLEGITWFHFSAICPALSQAAADVCLAAVKAASAKGLTISIDLNYRAKLWQYGKQPAEVMPELVQYANLVMGNIWAAEKMLKIPLAENIEKLNDKDAYLEQAKTTSRAITIQYPKCNWVANTFRFDQEQGINYYTTLYTDKQLLVSKTFTAEKILDKVGSGDCFMAGLIYGFYQKLEPLATLNFASAAAFNKLFIPSDCTISTIATIEQTLAEHDEK